jgi:hypothetical protein
MRGSKWKHGKFMCREGWQALAEPGNAVRSILEIFVERIDLLIDWN